MGVAATFAARVREIYGEDLVEEAGVVHVTSVWEAPDGAWRSIRIGAASPRSETDAFALAVARARADAIVTTGAILRLEPDLRHALPPAAAAWRAEALRRSRPPTTVVLTRRADVDLAHPLFAEARVPVVVVTGVAAAAALRRRVAASAEPLRVEPVAREETSLRDVIRWLRTVRACRSVLVEAGVTTSRALYDEPVAVDELMLSIHDAPTLNASAIGPVLLRSDDPLRARLEADSAARGEFTCREESGTWRFRRHRFAGVRPAR